MTKSSSLSQMINLSFENKVRASLWALFFERLWPRLWLIIGIALVFVLVSLAGLWTSVPLWAHKVALGLFGLSLFAAIIVAIRVRWPTRDEAVRRLERVSEIPHRPASSYEDTLSSTSTDSASSALWQAHRERLAAALKKLRIGRPHPRTDRTDPFALRMLLTLGAVLLVALAGRSAPERLAAAFTFDATSVLSSIRLDAWVAPPAYTGKPPVMLADGGRSAAAKNKTDKKGAAADTPSFLEVPVRSNLVVRLTGLDVPPGVTLEIKSDNKPAQIIKAKTPNTPAARAATTRLVELRHLIEEPSTVRLMAADREMTSWSFAVIPDELPHISPTRKPQYSRRGSMKLTYDVKDDYGVASALVKMKRSPWEGESADDTLAWARPQPLTGPRPPHERPPQLTLRLPKPNAQSPEASTTLELGQHPWAGLRVTMQLEAVDVAGQVGRSQSFEVVLPQREFENPLARAVIEQRRKLVEDPRNRDRVMRALDALTLEPKGFIDDIQVYLGLRTAYYRIKRDRDRTSRNSVIEQLWHVAVRIEDGDLSDAARRLREAQEKLANALRDGASDKALEEAMRELREALNEYAKQMEKQAQDNPMSPGDNERQQMLSMQDLDKMMRDIEDMAKSGAREQAEQMLSDMRDLLDRLQSGKMQQEQAERERQLNEQFNKLGDMVGDQQKLMDDTAGKQRSQRGGKQQGRMPGGKGKQQQGQQAGRGGRQQGQPGQSGARSRQQGGMPTPGQMGTGELGRRQREIHDRLAALQQRMAELGMGSPQQLDGARDAMRAAEDALREGDMGNAMSEQSRALEQMRQSAQSLANQMKAERPQRYGENGEQPRDPLGRPQRTRGPQTGDSVKVPDKIDMQQAREILEELRRRLGQATRAQEELDYIERLLERF